jgi:hypothetical protein
MSDIETVADLSDAERFSALTNRGNAPVEVDAPVEQDVETVVAPIVADQPVEAVVPSDENPSRMVPLSELIETRRAKQHLERENQQFAARLAAMEQQFRMSQAPKQPEPEIDLFDDPKRFVQQEFQTQVSEYKQMIRDLQIDTAVSRHGEDKVNQAQQVFDQALSSGLVNEHEARQVLGARNPWDAAVQWNQRREVLQATGGDLTAYRQRVLQEALADPAQRQSLMQMMAQQPAGNAPAALASTPKPAIKFPTSISSIGAAAIPKEDIADESPEDRFRRITSARR